jgi:signal transduction histidine kinase
MPPHSDPPDRPRTLLALRLAVLTACAWIMVNGLLTSWPRGAMTPEAVASLGITAVAGLLFPFGAWRILARPASARVRRETVVWLAVQTLMGCTVSTDFLVLVAVMLPLVLPERVARVWIVALGALLVITGLRVVGTPQFAAEPSLRGLPQGWQLVVTVGQMLGWILLAYAGGLLAATEIRSNREVRRLVSEVRATNQLLADASRLAERVHIARELHDTLGHRLAALGVHLELAERRAAGEGAAALHEARTITRELLADVREVVSDLRRERPLDLKRALARLLDETAGLEVEFTLSPDLDVPDPARAHALFRCAQEALTNTLRHAGASRAWLDVRQDPRGVTLRVSDDGRGALELREGHGLRGMRERLESLGGTLATGAAREGGLELTAWLPAAGGSA